LESVQKLLKLPDGNTYAGLRDYCMLLLQLDTGIRPGEMLKVIPKDVKIEVREIYVRP